MQQEPAWPGLLLDALTGISGFETSFWSGSLSSPQDSPITCVRHVSSSVGGKRRLLNNWVEFARNDFGCVSFSRIFLQSSCSLEVVRPFSCCWCCFLRWKENTGVTCDSNGARVYMHSLMQIHVRKFGRFRKFMFTFSHKYFLILPTFSSNQKLCFSVEGELPNYFVEFKFSFSFDSHRKNGQWDKIPFIKSKI